MTYKEFRQRMTPVQEKKADFDYINLRVSFRPWIRKVPQNIVRVSVDGQHRGVVCSEHDILDPVSGQVQQHRRRHHALVVIAVDFLGLNNVVV